MKLVIDMRPGAYLVQMDWFNELLISAYYIIVLVVYKEFSNSIMDKEVFSSLYNNRGAVELI